MQVDFDFNVGCLTESPCRRCQHYAIPSCVDGCEVLASLQETMANTVETSLEVEEYRLNKEAILNAYFTWEIDGS